MSIYCSFGMFDEHGNDDIEFGHPQPYAYRRSHIIPTTDDPRGGYLDFGSIPGFITRDGRDEGDDGEYWPWLRVSLRGTADEPDTVVLDVGQVDALIADLVAWRACVDEDLS